MAFKRDDRVVAARKALKGAKKSARKDRGTGMPQAKESGGLFDEEGEAERKGQIQAGRELAVARGVRPGTERPAPMFENIPKEFDPDFEDEFVMEGETTKQAPFKGVGGYSYTQNAAGDYEFVGPDGKKGVAKKGTKAHASIFSEMTGKGSLYKKTGSSGGTSSRSAPAQTTPAAPGGFTGPTLAMLEGGESEVENTFGATSEVDARDFSVPGQSDLTEEDMQLNYTYDPFSAEEMQGEAPDPAGRTYDRATDVRSLVDTLSQRTRNFGDAPSSGGISGRQQAAAFALLQPALEAKIASSMSSGKANRNFARRVSGLAMSNIDYDAIAAGADIDEEVDKAITMARRSLPDITSNLRSAVRATGEGTTSGHLNRLSGPRGFEARRDDVTQTRNVDERLEEEEARQRRTASGGQVLE